MPEKVLNIHFIDCDGMQCTGTALSNIERSQEFQYDLFARKIIWDFTVWEPKQACFHLKVGWLLLINPVYETATTIRNWLCYLLLIKMCYNFTTRKSCLRGFIRNFDGMLPHPTNLTRTLSIYLRRSVHWQRVTRQEMTHPDTVFADKNWARKQYQTTNIFQAWEECSRLCQSAPQ